METLMMVRQAFREESMSCTWVLNGMLWFRADQKSQDR
jgi:hypothetical protein